jgi:hypothetical protein
MWSLLAAASEALVNWTKKDGKTEYAISFNPEYKINVKAPFNFTLLDSEKKSLEKIEWSSFVKDNAGIYRYLSGKNEKYLKYWFVACKYQKDEVIACKTFSQTIEIK